MPCKEKGAETPRALWARKAPRALTGVSPPIPLLGEIKLLCPPINFLFTILFQKRIDLRERLTAEKPPVGAQRAWVRRLQNEPRMRGCGADVADVLQTLKSGGASIRVLRETSPLALILTPPEEEAPAE